LDGLTRSSNGRDRNDAARGSILVALVALAVPVVAFAAARKLNQVSLLQATGATAASGVLGLAALFLARRGRRNIERTIGRVGGEGTARVGRLLGVISVCLALTGGIALGVYALLNLFG
jgi:hypothetical protein